MTTEATPDVDPAEVTVDTPAGTTPPDTSGLSIPDLRIRLEDRKAWLEGLIVSHADAAKAAKAAGAEARSELDEVERMLKATQPRAPRKPRQATAAKKAAAK